MLELDSVMLDSEKKDCKIIYMQLNHPKNNIQHLRTNDVEILGTKITKLVNLKHSSQILLRRRTS